MKELTAEEFSKLLDLIYTRGGNPEWLLFGCGCEYDGIHGKWVHRCDSGSWCSFLQKRRTVDIIQEWRLDDEDLQAEEGVGERAESGGGDPDQAG